MKKLTKKECTELVAKAKEAMQRAYVPYSHFTVGAALLAENGTVYMGCNIENAAYTPTNCAERTAVFKAVSEGVLSFRAIAVVGGKDGVLDGFCPPCGVCRQVLMEFCDPDTFEVLLGDEKNIKRYLLKEILPEGFGPGYLIE